MNQGQGSNENKLKFFAAKVLPHNIKEENANLLKRLQVYSQMSKSSNNGFGENL